jgi:Zn-finger nucleic acid-binding protein
MKEKKVMNCPVCKDVTLVMSDRQGIEVDYCPQCRGVWLDRGELDKIIDRTVSGGPGVERSASRPPEPEYRERRDHDDDRDDYDKRDPRYRKKKGGFLGELFDFD